MSNLPFVEEILADLRRFAECVEDGQDVDLGRDRFDLLTQLGLLERIQRSPARWMMTKAGEDAIAPPAAAHEGDGRTCRFCQKRFDSTGECGNHVDQFHHGESEPVVHGDEAAQYRLLRVGEVIQATDELLRDDCTTWQPMSDGPQIGIGWGWHAGLMPVRRIDAAMRAQAGEGGEV